MQPGPRLAYLTTHYPALSHTFILREVAALRRLGMDVHTVSLRKSAGEHLLSQENRDAAQSTYAVRPARVRELLAAHLAALVRHPRGYLATLGEALSRARPGAKGRLWQVFYFGEAIVLWRHCAALDVHHIHAHHASAPADVALLAARFGNRAGRGPATWSLTVHGPDELRDVSRFSLAEKVQRADAVVCISYFARSQLMALVDDRHWAKLRVVHCGVIPSQYEHLSAAAPARRQVLCVGRLVPAKGHAVLLAAVASLVADGHDIEAVLVGSGPLRERLEQLASELGVAERIVFRGALGQDELRRCYASASLCCSSSFAEGVPVVLMEAMASGLPVIATAISGVRELICDGDSGLLVTPGRIGELSQAIAALLSDAALGERLARAGRERVSCEFDVDRCAEQLVERVQHAVATRPSRAPDEGRARGLAGARARSQRSMSERSTPAVGAPAALRIACVVSFLDEERYLPAFLDSMAGQERFPDLLVLVDDGSTDASPMIAARFAAAHPNVRLLRRAPRPRTRDRLALAAELRSFHWGLDEVELEWDLAVKMDADLELSPDLFYTLERAFLSTPELGIAGAYLSVIDRRTGMRVRERCPPQHVRGATKFYRRACLQSISPIPPILGWDTIDELAARRHGWRTASLDCPRGDTIHLRAAGSTDGRLRAHYRWGVCAYGIGQHPLWVILSAARRLGDSPRLLGSGAFIAGWMLAAVRRGPRAARGRTAVRAQRAAVDHARASPLDDRRVMRRLLNRLRGYPSRRWLIRRGLRLGRDVYIDDFAAFDHGFPWLISIGDEAVLSAGVRIVAHDGSTKHWAGYIRVGRVDIGPKVYIGAHALVLPGVTIGANAIVGAGSVVRHDVAPGSIVLGNPAVEVGTVEGFTAKHRSRIAERPCYPRAGFSAYEHVSAAGMRAMIDELSDGCGYVE